MAPGKVKAAFKAMKDIGIPEEKTKPALKKLLKLFDKNWDLIEEENYRVLADTIFEYEDSEAAEKEKKKIPGNVDQEEAFEEAAPVQDEVQDEPERPLKRLRLKHQGQDAPSQGQHSPPSACAFKTPKLEPGESEVSLGQRTQPTGSPQPVAFTRNKGKQPVSPQVSQRDKRTAPERASQALQIKEPRAEPVVNPRQKQPNTILLKPKDEPFTEDMMTPAPLAVLPPVRSHKEVPSNSSNPVGSQAEFMRQEVPSNSGNAVCSQNGQDSRASKSVGVIDKGLGTLASPNAQENHIQEAEDSKRTPANIDIAASSLGEVRLSLSCNPGPQGNDFYFPDLQVVLKKVNDNCLTKYKITDPEFSVMKVMEDFCECAGKLGTKADDMNQEGSSQQDAGVIDCNGTGCLQLNGSINAESSDNVAATTEMTAPDASNPTSAFNCKPVDVHSDINATDNHCAEKDSNVTDSNVNSLVVVQQQQIIPSSLEILDVTSDISRGIEAVKVSVEKSNCDSLPLFHYIPQNVISHNADLSFSLAQIGDQDCCHSCLGDCLALSSSCNCARRNGGKYSYNSDGLVKEEFLDKCISMVQNPQKDYLVYCKECPLERLKNEDMLDPCKGHLRRTFIKECWTKCGCNKHCGNKVIQHGISHNLQVFWTAEGKGWGLRTLENLPKGTFVCEYVGEILTSTELHKRNLRRSNDKHSYAVLLDTEWGTRALKESEILCLDATLYGNVARFINHRCSDANLIEIPVEVETPNHHYYHVALFTTRAVNAFEELTWDYGVDFDDGEHPIKAFRCLCGSSFCRNMKRSNRSRSTLTLQ
ncbi:probable inactive histone-lysine N-methyltransferase SUVR2 [Chenopodium quinoa]|uniref:probable inactive histone-lysine N-methyltransferase SUVR2 n=1 Tax=Chenopodium quinoa TaxID=63459 RepID=UPI000B78014C|nr:probable inactive histone-lysine N-methyltransferase SUVR2 [Chenopodium quinoa]XP_021722197.1 probable inactive histone-lysine N-methyltransferase SUVR2 [Chenopodium quinoa]